MHNCTHVPAKSNTHTHVDTLHKPRSGAADRQPTPAPPPATTSCQHANSTALLSIHPCVQQQAAHHTCVHDLLPDVRQVRLQAAGHPAVRPCQAGSQYRRLCVVRRQLIKRDDNVCPELLLSQHRALRCQQHLCAVPAGIAQHTQHSTNSEARSL